MKYQRLDKKGIDKKMIKAITGTQAEQYLKNVDRYMSIARRKGYIMSFEFHNIDSDEPVLCVNLHYVTDTEGYGAQRRYSIYDVVTMTEFRFAKEITAWVDEFDAYCDYHFKGGIEI